MKTIAIFLIVILCALLYLLINDNTKRIEKLEERMNQKLEWRLP